MPGLGVGGLNGNSQCSRRTGSPLSVFREGFQPRGHGWRPCSRSRTALGLFGCPASCLGVPFLVLRGRPDAHAPTTFCCRAVHSAGAPARIRPCLVAAPSLRRRIFPRGTSRTRPQSRREPPRAGRPWGVEAAGRGGRSSGARPQGSKLPGGRRRRAFVASSFPDPAGEPPRAAVRVRWTVRGRACRRSSSPSPSARGSPRQCCRSTT